MEEEEIEIRYQTIFDFLRREKTRAELQELPNNFSLKVIDYINEQNDLINGKGTEKDLSYIEKQRLIRELDNLKKLLGDLHERREKKILDIVLLKLKTYNLSPDANNLTTEEEDLFNKIESILVKTRKVVLNDVYSRTESKTPKLKTRPRAQVKDKKESIDEKTGETQISHEKKTVEFTKEMDKFVGPSLEPYGPFKPGDTAELPTVIIEILKKKNAIKEL